MEGHSDSTERRAETPAERLVMVICKPRSRQSKQS